ncbi:MAG TPA: hypothetical protein VGM90_30770 [Kofleriaceae bacterium]|jgi:hypothetical protein
MTTREVIVGDGVEFLRQPLPPGAAIFTSLPDHSEIPSMGVDAWKTWFIDGVALACRAVADDAVAVFYQTDVKHDGRWVDKGHMVMCGVDAAGSHALFHKIVCRVAAGMTTFGRPAYAHLIAVSRERRLSPGASTPDVLPELGRMTWARAMGGAAVKVAMDFIASTGATCVVDPFCGHGTALAAANTAGMDAIGVELSRRRAAKARQA